MAQGTPFFPDHLEGPAQQAEHLGQQQPEHQQQGGKDDEGDDRVRKDQRRAAHHGHVFGHACDDVGGRFGRVIDKEARAGLCGVGGKGCASCQ